MKKFFVLFCSLFISLFMLVGCGHETNSETNIEVKSFKTSKDSYSKGEKINFLIEFDNSEHKKITSVDINGKDCPLKTNSIYKLVYTDTDFFTFSSDEHYFKMNSFTYEGVDEKGQPKSFTEKVNLNCIAKEHFEIAPDLKIVSFNAEGNIDNFTLGKEDLNLVIEVNYNKKNMPENELIKISHVNYKVIPLKFSDGEYIPDETKKPVTSYYTVPSNDVSTHFSKDNKEVSITFAISNDIADLISNYGHFRFEAISVNYTSVLKPGKKQTTEKLTESIGFKINVISPGFTIARYNIKSIENSDGDKLEKTFNFNKDLIVEKNTIITMELAIKKELNNNAKITYITIGGQKIRPAFKTTGLIDIMEFKFKLDATSVSKVEEFRFDIESISLNNNQVFKFPSKIVPTSGEEKVLAYDKVVKNIDDLSVAKQNNSIFLASNLVLTPSNHKATNLLFNNFNFKGLFEGNGKTISANFSYNFSKPIFNKIEKDAEIKNLNLSVSNNDDNLLANINDGILRNLSIDWKTTYTKENYKHENSGLVGLNDINGILKDIRINSITFKFNIKNGSSDFSIITPKNNGAIERIIIGSINGFNTNTGASDKTNIYLITKENAGSALAVVAELKNLEDFKTMALFNKFTFVLDPSTSDGSLNDIYINEKVCTGKNISDKYFAQISSNCITVTKEQLGINHNNEQIKKQFYISNGFINDGIEYFWDIDGTGVLKLAF